MSWQSLYPFESKFFPLTSGQRMHYVDEGKGPCVVLVHGNPTWSFYYRHLISGLRNRHRMIAIDHIGSGLSDKPRRYDYCLAQHTANLLELLDHLKLSGVTVIGHDWGGAIATNAVRKQVDRFQRILLFNTGAFVPRRIPWRIAVCRTPLLGPLAVRGCNAFVRAALHMAMVDPRKLNSDERNGILAPYDSWANRIGVQRFVDDIPFSAAHPTWSELDELERALPAMAIPKMLIWGMRDWCFDAACLDRFIAAWPDAEVVKLDDAGHWIVEERRAEVLSLVRRFLNAECTPQLPQDEVAYP